MITATYPVTVTAAVTAEHLRLGDRYDCARCPVALALQPHFPEKEVYVGGRMVWIGRHPYTLGQPEVTYMVDAITRNRISDFDTERPVEPWTVTITRSPAREQAP